MLIKQEKHKNKGKYLMPFQRKLLQKNSQENLSDKQRQRIQIMLLADEGKSQTDICRELGCCHATARHWITMAKTNQAHKWNAQSIGRPVKTDEVYLKRLKQLVSQSPQSVNIPHTEYRYSFQNWTAQKLSQHLDSELGVKVTPQHINRVLKQMGLSARNKPTSEVKVVANLNKIQIADLASVSAIEVDEMWQFSPLANG